MPTWSPAQYLKFAAERTRPCRDLASRISVADVRRIVDLGSGPGNSTEVLASLWPNAELTALDNSEEMVETGRQKHPTYRWISEDIVRWAASESGHYDIVFSNAALQWVPDHTFVFPQLLERVAPGGALAIQMPCDVQAPANRLMHELAESPVRSWHAHDTSFYYDLVSVHALSVDLWETTYIHVLEKAEDIVEWYKGTGLRPFLEALATEAQREQFLLEYLKGIRNAYPPQADGHVLLPFRRIFLIAYR
jgi:trans-aconitate 2-methyltransferase